MVAMAQRREKIVHPCLRAAIRRADTVGAGRERMRYSVRSREVDVGEGVGYVMGRP